MLKSKILNRDMGIVTYAITPPKKSNSQEKIIEISQRHVERIKNIDIDGLIIYDIQDEGDRLQDKRPFPFLETINPAEYSRKYMQELTVEKIIYRCVGKYHENELRESIASDLQEDKFSVFVGAASREQEVKLKLSEAYNIREKLEDKLTLGGVVIPERHTRNKDEHMRIINKTNKGCKFFVSQVIYDIEVSKNLLSDYFYYCKDNHMEMVPILFTLTPCGSIKTLEFMKWLGINVPKWMENELIHSNDILDKSINLAKNIFEELLDFALDKGIPIGCNVESLSIRKVEIEASIQLVRDIKLIIENKLKGYKYEKLKIINMN
ncbi:methylenetetrahydrofolate reductase [Clostridium pasteurianum]|uniref:Methylenetetrahydrofolate reductase n=1 Tax=Clostridium pasteurianum BC1 TaxID=86416 RepID=R4JXI8_CLOPA|nr:methylenetetrahydrofolate reductase [Clostridium pasteurianum]AGK95512.1 5,10-methylenetetrahydrofolate reductase [Clostridium pasteurianum BC1]